MSLKNISVTVQILDVKKISEMPGAWTAEDYSHILELCDYPDVDKLSEAELPEMCLMALSEFEPEDAAEKLLNYRLNHLLTEGQIHQLSYEMQEDLVAEEYPNILAHHQLFNINQLLNKAFKNRFPGGKAVSAEMRLNLSEPYSFEQIVPDQDFLIRVLAQCLPAHNVINRLYDDQLINGESITDAEGIIWAIQPLYQDVRTKNLRVFSSLYWLDDLDETPEFNVEISLPLSKEAEE